MSRITKTIAGLVISLAMWSAAGSAVQAVPMDPAQEAHIRKSAVMVKRAVDEYANRRDRETYDQFIDLSDKLAINVANFLGINPRSMQLAWRAASVAHQRALMAGLTQIGVPYKEYGVAESVAFDCSGLIQFAWASAGYELPRGSSSQYAHSRRISMKHAQAGDLMWRPGHISMYLGVDGAILQSGRTGRSVELHLMDKRILSWTRFANPIA